MKEYAVSCLMIGLLLTTVASAALSGSLVPDTISEMQALGETRTYTLDYCVEISGGLTSADVLFLTDSTASMTTYISGIKSAFNGILSTIEAELPGLDIKYGVADYKNYEDGGNYAEHGLNLRLPFTDDMAAAQSAINSMEPEGGDDFPESQLKALVNLAGNWLTPSGDLGFAGRTDAQKILIWAGDSEGHHSGEGGDVPADYYPSLIEALAALNSQGILAFALNTQGAGTGIDLNHGGANQATYIANGTGGQLFNEVGSGGFGIQETIVNAITVGVEVLSNITLTAQNDSALVVQPLNQTVTGAWTSNDSPVCGSFNFDVTAPDLIGVDYFDMVLLGNGAELDRASVQVTTVPEPTSLLLFGLGALAMLKRPSR